MFDFSQARFTSDNFKLKIENPFDKHLHYDAKSLHSSWNFNVFLFAFFLSISFCCDAFLISKFFISFWFYSYEIVSNKNFSCGFFFRVNHFYAKL